MKPENPERLWACVCSRGGPPAICADFERDDVLCDRQGWESSDDYSEIVPCIRADIAAAEKAALVAERDALRAALADRGESDFCRQAVADRVALKAALEAVAGFLGTEWLPWKARTAALDALDALAGKGVV